ncbi:hypothetical protein MKW92_018624 [Papaver armeniacum]|nr:hypothetical protein MKW92_018624 [Papaver armeniacum]
MESSLPNEQVKNTETTHSSNSLSMEPHDQHNGEIKDTHKVVENGHNTIDNETLVQEICGDDFQHKDGESKGNGLVLADPLVEEMMNSKSSKEPLIFILNLNLVTSSLKYYWTSNGRDFNYYLPLYQAALKGDWGIAEEFLKTHPDALNAVITSNQRTALHVAASAGHLRFTLKLVALMDVDALALQDSYNGDTALHFASVAGITEAAKAMITKNNNLTQIQNKNGWTALLLYMIQYLCTETRNEEPSMPFSGFFGAQLLCNITAAGLHDVALYLVQRYPNLATARDQSGCAALSVLAQKLLRFPVEASWDFGKVPYIQVGLFLLIPLQVDDNRVNCSNGINMYRNYQVGSGDLSNRGAWIKFLSWTNLIKVPGIKQIYLKKLAHIQAMELLKCICAKISLLSNNDILQFFLNSNILITAAKFGIVEIVIECIQTFPDQIWFICDGRSIFHIAVEHRKEKIFNLMYGMSAQKKILASWRVESNNNILHLAAKLAPSSQLHTVSGAALQMQRDLQWFKEVEKLVQPTYKELENQDRRTPRDVFTSEHKDLMEKGEKWMKDTAQSCMVVATLIATVVFAGAFTVPGGNISDADNANNGSPIFLHNNAFMWFVVSDALGLFSSTTSVLMFLSILTSRYAEEDFLRSLPKRLIIGLGTLFISIAAMMIAFAAALSIVLQRKLQWASIPIALVACLPVTLFALLQFPLLVEIYLSTYGVGIFRADSKYKLD